jgi:hypothetical protein
VAAMRCFLLSVLLVLSVLNVRAQKDCYFKIDKRKIVENKNLDFFISRMQSDSFILYNDVAQIPSYIRAQISCLVRDTLFANPDMPYAAGCTNPLGWPVRQLVFGALRNDIFILVYRKGGFVSLTKMIFFQFKDGRLLDLWTDRCYDYNVNNVGGVLKDIQETKKKKLGFHNSDSSF